MYVGQGRVLAPPPPPTRDKMLLMLAGLPECVAFRAFDCNSQSSQIEQ